MVANPHGNLAPWTIICDDNCPVVKFLARLVKSCDSRRVFTVIGQNEPAPQAEHLTAELAASPWSLLLVDDENERWHGPDAIPYILKNLPSGRIAAVAYTLPGTMWITRKLYYLVSCNRRHLAQIKLQSREAAKSGGVQEAA